MTEILDYEGQISMICRWNQELLGYHFTVVHHSNRMMIDVDSLSRLHESFIVTHCIVTSILHQINKNHRPRAYDKATFLSSHSSKLSPPETPITTTPILLSIFVILAYVPTEGANPVVGQLLTISTSQILFTSTTINSDKSLITVSNNNEMLISAITREIFSD